MIVGIRSSNDYISPNRLHSPVTWQKNRSKYSDNQATLITNKVEEGIGFKTSFVLFIIHCVNLRDGEGGIWKKP